MLISLKESFTQNIFTKLIGLLARPALSHLKKRMDPAKYNGASMLGLNGIVIKSHGGANSIAFKYAIDEAVRQIENNVVNLVRDKINDFIQQGLLL